VIGEKPLRYISAGVETYETMSLEILTGSANPALAQQVAQVLGVELAPRILERFPDGELHVEVQKSGRGSQVFLIQPTCLPVDEKLFELFLMSDACKRRLLRACE
jgi:ribose-phosphate pyrophosphokinase